MKLLVVFGLLYLAVCSSCLHLTGTWKTSEFFLFLAKFGFQKTNIHHKTDRQGYIYGNITSKDNRTDLATLVVVDKEYFLGYYHNKSIEVKSDACQSMFTVIDTIAYDTVCAENGQEYMLRRVPCPIGGLCPEHETFAETPLVSGFQFTYQIYDLNEPRFWYVSLVSCVHEPQPGSSHAVTAANSKCRWTNTDGSDAEIDYDIWLVNGNPYTKQRNPLEFQFSYDRVDTVEIYTVFFVAYAVAVPLQAYAMRKRCHQLTQLLTLCMVLEFVGVFLNVVHSLKFAFDGVGVARCNMAGNLIGIIAECLMILMLLLVAKGWTITRMHVTCKLLGFVVWTAYTCVYVFLFVWNLMEVDVIQDVDEYQTWPGWLILGFRLCIMVWFLLELRGTFLLENKPEKLDFYLHFGAGFLAWFVYLPIVAIIASQVSALWRFKLLLSVTSSADLFAYAVLVHMLWPTRAASYFQIQSDLDELEEEMEEFETETIIGEVPKAVRT